MRTIQLKLFNECFAGHTKFFCGSHVRHLWLVYEQIFGKQFNGIFWHLLHFAILIFPYFSIFMFLQMNWSSTGKHSISNASRKLESDQNDNSQRLMLSCIFSLCLGIHLINCCNLFPWRCVECAVHHERNVCEEQHHICVARTSNNRVISSGELYCCLLPQCEALRTCRSGFPFVTKWCCDQDVKVVPSEAFPKSTCDRRSSLKKGGDIVALALRWMRGSPRTDCARTMAYVARTSNNTVISSG